MTISSLNVPHLGPMGQNSIFEVEMKTRISPELKDRLDAEAGKLQVKTAHLVREAIREFLDRRIQPKRVKAAAR